MFPSKDGAVTPKRCDDRAAIIHGGLMNPVKILVPLGLATFVAGLVIGFSSITLISSEGAGCGSAFDPGTGTLNTSVQAACAPIVSEKDNWATALVFVGLGLLASALFNAAPMPIRGSRLHMSSPPPPHISRSPGPQSWASDPPTSSPPSGPPWTTSRPPMNPYPPRPSGNR